MLLAAYYAVGFGVQRHWMAAVCWGIAAEQWFTYAVGVERCELKPVLKLPDFST
jgi:hypothetical protein